MSTTHRPTEVRKRKVVSLRSKGWLRKKIAKKLGIKVKVLKELYAKELKKGDKLKVVDAPRKATVDSRFTRSKDIPAHSVLTAEEFEPFKSRTVKWDDNGMPCDRHGKNLLGKRIYDELMGKKALEKSPEWGPVVSRSKDYGDISIGGSKWDLSLPDWETRLMARTSLIPPGIPVDLVDLRMKDLKPGYKFKRADNFNVELAQRAIVAFNNLRLADVDGTPQMSVASEDWFRELVAVIFGSYDPKTKSRMIRELFVLVPKKNNKTTGGALIMLLLLIFNERPKGEALMTAPVKDVAQIAFDAMAGAIELDPVLASAFIVKPHKKVIISRKTKAKLSVITFDPAALTGKKVFAALIDELHVMMKIGKAGRAIRQIRGGMLPFPEAILIFITTQSEEVPVGVFKAELETARSVRDGEHKNARMLPVLYEFPESIQKSPDEAWKNPKIWPLVTPNAGRSIAIEDLIVSYRDAEKKGKEELKSWASQHLNIQIGLALKSDSWSGAKIWETAVSQNAVSLKHLLDVCEVVEIGIDGGGLDDFLSMAVVGRETDTGTWLAWTKSWVSKLILEHRKEEAQTFEEFANSGDLVLVESLGEDVEELVSIVEQCEKSGLLDRIGLDPYGVGTVLDEILKIQGIDETRVVGISQGWRLGGVIKTVERALSEGKFKHGGQPINGWAAANAKVEPKGNAILITKSASGAGKIDPLMAIFDATHLIASNPTSKAKRFQMLVFGGGKGASRKVA